MEILLQVGKRYLTRSNKKVVTVKRFDNSNSSVLYPYMCEMEGLKVPIYYAANGRYSIECEKSTDLVEEYKP